MKRSRAIWFGLSSKGIMFRDRLKQIIAAANLDWIVSNPYIIEIQSVIDRNRKSMQEVYGVGSK